MLSTFDLQETIDTNEQDKIMDAQHSMAERLAFQLADIISPLNDGECYFSGNVPKLAPAELELQKMQYTVLRTRCLIKKLKLFCGQHSAKIQAIHLSPLIKNFLQNFNHYIPKDIEITASIEEDLPMVLADPTLMQKLLFNLCRNSVEALSQNGGIIRVDLRMSVSRKLNSTEKQEEYSLPTVELKIDDTGPGICQQDIHRIFHPFFSTKVGKIYKGLGLSEVYGIVKCMGASLKIKSKINFGTSVKILFPAK